MAVRSARRRGKSVCRRNSQASTTAWGAVPTRQCPIRKDVPRDPQLAVVVRRPIRSPPHRAQPVRCRCHAGGDRSRIAGRVDRPRGSRLDSVGRAAGTARSSERGRRPGCAANPGEPEPARDEPDRCRVLRHRHAGGDPAQRARESCLVHGVHAVPTGDQPGPSGSVAELPDDGGRPDRPRHLQCLVAG